MADKERPTSFSDLFPGRFLDAPMLKGRHVTITIAGVYQEAPPKGQTDPVRVVEIEGKDKEWSLNKTNGRCLRAMFGDDPQAWGGHKVTIYPDTCEAFGDVVDCIRIAGSPELSKEIKVQTYQGRKKVKVVLKPTGKQRQEQEQEQAPAPADDPDRDGKA